jgi:hypothetical protein
LKQQSVDKQLVTPRVYHGRQYDSAGKEAF